MDPKLKWRQRAKLALEGYFRRRSLPRLALSLLLILTGGVGFLISFALLHLGVPEMWIRYPVAVLGGYAAFLALIRVWVEVERSRFDPEAADLRDAFRQSAELEERSDYEVLHPRHSDSWLGWVDLPDLDFDDPGGCLIAILLGAVIGVLVILAVALAQAPVLVAEVFLDAFLVSVLYRRLRIAAEEHWLGTAIRKTWLSAVAIALLLGVAGKCLDLLAPGAHSIGPALHWIVNPAVEKPE
jgi:hypothetical protein